MEGQGLQHREEKVSRGNNPKPGPPEDAVHTTGRLPDRVDFSVKRYTAGHQTAWSHPKFLEEPRQFHIHNLVVFFLKRAPPNRGTSGPTTPDPNPRPCRICHCAAACRLNAPFGLVPPPGSAAVEVNVFLPQQTVSRSPSCWLRNGYITQCPQNVYCPARPYTIPQETTLNT